MTLPRLAAFAESAWTPSIGKNRTDFMERLRPFFRELDRREIPYFNSYEPEKTPEPFDPSKTANGTGNG